MEVEEKPKPKDNKDAGGGGGGGRKEETPTSKGRLATQTEEPLIAPTKTIPQKDNFELKQIASTQGNIKRKATDEAYGDPNSKYSLSSDGTGSGGGQGSGTGTGQGSGRGTGEGSGIGSGSGRGTGNGNGDGRGDGNQGRTAVTSPPPPPPKKVEPVGVTESVKIISKPKALYSDPARQNQVQGTVRLRVTFSANGQIAGISAVSGLPYGLTEQAIAAARAIKFEPAKKNGVPISVTKQVEYNFTMY
jgi:TonB family protein